MFVFWDKAPPSATRATYKMQLSPFLRCLDCGVCVAIRLVRFGYNPSTGRIALRVAPISPFPLAREPTVTAWRGTTLSARIDKCRTLIMPPRFVRRLRNNMAQSLVLFVKLGVRFARRRCGSCSVFEVTHSVNKCARTGFRIRLRLPQLLIINYSLLIINCVLSLPMRRSFFSGAGVPPLFIHQADNLAKLRFKFLSLL